MNTFRVERGLEFNSKSSDFRLLIVFAELAAIAVFIFLFYTVPTGVDNSILTLNLVAFYLLFIRSLVSTKRVVPTIASPLTFETLFLFMSYLVFYHNYQLYLFGASDLTGGEDFYSIKSFVDGSNAAITLSTIGLLAFTMGYRALSCATREPPFVPAPKGSREPSPYLNGMALATTGLLLLLIGLYLLQGWRSAGEGRYAGATTGGFGVEGVYLATGMLCMNIVGLWVYARMQGYATPMILKVGIVLAVAWCFRLTAFGDRNVVQLVALAAAGGYFTLVRRPSKIVIILVILLALYLYGVIEVGREMPGGWYLPGNFMQLVQEPRFLEALIKQPSFNLSTISVRGSVEAVPDTYGYLYGVGKVLSILSIIPFGATVLAPSLRPEYQNSALLLRDIMVGPHGGFAPGTTIISDPYMDFSVPGVVVSLFALGLFAAVVRNMVAKHPDSLLHVVVYVLCLAMYSQLPRYSFESLLRPVAWTVLLAVIVRMLTEAHIQPPAPVGTARTASRG